MRLKLRPKRSQTQSETKPSPPSPLPFLREEHTTNCATSSGWGCSSVGRAWNQQAAGAGSIPHAANDFSARVNFQYRLSYGVGAPSCAIACINICAHVKDLVVHVRVRWIIENTKIVAAGFRRGKQPKFPTEEVPIGQYS